MNEYPEEEFLQLSGLQHFAFCRRQWALIHLEGRWKEDYRTADGRSFHDRAHNADLTEKRGGLLITRELAVFSPTLGVSGKCDVVEFRSSSAGVRLPRRDGLWLPFPVEYKRGAPKTGPWDALQLCGQAMCLEEMLLCAVPSGALYYGETRRRQAVDFTPELREQVRANLAEMHELSHRGHTPNVKPSKSCGACSLKELCLPALSRSPSVSSYLKSSLEAKP